MKNIQGYVDYCTGCGLCQSALGIELVMGEDGYLSPTNCETREKELKRICPYGGNATEYMDINKIWGRTEEFFLGWSKNSEIRTKASSGGVITSLCCYLLEQHKVDGIIHTVADDIYHTKTQISRTVDEIKLGMGSRYSASSPLKDILQIMSKDEKYVFVGKPCDVSALRMYLIDHKELEKQIPYLFSFFCAGMPSENAQKELLLKLGCGSKDECESLQYRGNGWPGHATVVKKDGTTSTMSYNDSWGKILGRDIRKICRFCLDGIGEMADISCGDAWYLDNNNNPDFTEGEGRNVIFARTDKGINILNEAKKASYLELYKYDKCEEELKFIQKYQYERRTTMYAMIKALKICGRPVPNFSRKVLRSFEKMSPLILRIKRFLGTIKRVIHGRI